MEKRLSRDELRAIAAKNGYKIVGWRSDGTGIMVKDDSPKAAINAQKIMDKGIGVQNMSKEKGNASQWAAFGADLGLGILNSGLNILNNERNIRLQKDTNADNIAESRRVQAINQKNIEIMRQREDTEVQRRQADLKAAGINPLLAGLGGASAAVGGMISNPIPSTAPQSDMRGLSLMSFLNAKQVSAQIEETKAQTEKIKAETKTEEATRDPTVSKIIADTELAESSKVAQTYQNQLTEAKTNETKENIKMIAKQMEVAQKNMELTDAQIGLAKARTSTESKLQDFYSANVRVMSEQINKIKAETGMTNLQAQWFVASWWRDTINLGLNHIESIGSLFHPIKIIKNLFKSLKKFKKGGMKEPEWNDNDEGWLKVD